MAELKTKLSRMSPEKFLNAIKDDGVRADCRAIADIMAKATKAQPRMWGPAIVGFGSYTYKYADGREMEWMMIAFSPRKQNITLYVRPFDGYDELLAELGKHSCGKSCLYIKRLSDVHVPTLKKLIAGSVRQLKSGSSR